MEPKIIDPTVLQKGDEVHYYGYDTSDGGVPVSIIEKGTVQSDNLYIDGVTVHGDGWKQYVGKWFICKVIRNGNILFEQ